MGSQEPSICGSLSLLWIQNQHLLSLASAQSHVSVDAGGYPRLPHPSRLLPQALVPCPQLLDLSGQDVNKTQLSTSF